MDMGNYPFIPDYLYKNAIIRRSGPHPLSKLKQTTLLYRAMKNNGLFHLWLKKSTA